MDFGSNPTGFKLGILSHWVSSKKDRVSRVEITRLPVFIQKLGLLCLFKGQAASCDSALLNAKDIGESGFIPEISENGDVPLAEYLAEL